MTFRQFAFNNVRRNSRQYVSYYLSSMFSVTVFFMYAVLVFHPEVQSATFRASVQRGIFAAEIIIFVFSFLFVLYSTGSFLKSRKTEYGLLSTLGITKSQLNRLIMIENTIIGLVSIISGLVVGGILSKIFIMLFSEILKLEDPLSYYLAPKAIMVTAVAYFIMFELNSFFALWTIRMNSVIELFRGAKAPKKTPKFSWILSVLGIGLIGYGYYLAYDAELLTITGRMLPILAVIVPGTYLLFTQASIAVTSILQKQKRFYFKRTNLLTISDLVYKLKDNARLLFLVTILSAIAFTSSGVLFGLFKGIQGEAEKYIPQSVSLITKNNPAIFDKSVTEVKQNFDEKGIPYKYHQGALVEAGIHYPQKDVYTSVHLMALDDFKTFLANQGKDTSINLNDNQALFLAPPILVGEETKIPKELNFEGSGYEKNLEIKIFTAHSINKSYYVRYMYVVPNQVFEAFKQHASPDQTYQYMAMEIPNWTKHVDGILETIDKVDTNDLRFDSQAHFYDTYKQGFALTFYFGVFISVLFFLAAGSILYFRLYQDIDNDMDHYRALYRIGLTEKEMKKIASKQVSLIFFIPFAVAVIHSAFAFKALQNMLSSSIILPSTLIIGAFLVIHILNYLIIRNRYISKLL